MKTSIGKCNICLKDLEESKPVYFKNHGFTFGRVQKYKCNKCGVTHLEIYEDYSTKQIKQMSKEFGEDFSLDVKITMGNKAQLFSLDKSEVYNGK